MVRAVTGDVGRQVTVVHTLDSQELVETINAVLDDGVRGSQPRPGSDGLRTTAMASGGVPGEFQRTTEVIGPR